MIALIQRVSEASVKVDDVVIGQIDKGLLVLLGVDRDDDEANAKRLVEKVLSYRVFADEQGKMNLNVLQAGGQLLVVSQFTLVADTQKGTRAGFSKGAAPDKANQLYQYFTQICAQRIAVETGQFGADMKVSLVNDGPVTFWLEV